MDSVCAKIKGFGPILEQIRRVDWVQFFSLKNVAPSNDFQIENCTCS